MTLLFVWMAWRNLPIYSIRKHETLNPVNFDSFRHQVSESESPRLHMVILAAAQVSRPCHCVALSCFLPLNRAHVMQPKAPPLISRLHRKPQPQKVEIAQMGSLVTETWQQDFLHAGGPLFLCLFVLYLVLFYGYGSINQIYHRIAMLFRCVISRACLLRQVMLLPFLSMKLCIAGVSVFDVADFICPPKSVIQYFLAVRCESASS